MIKLENLNFSYDKYSPFKKEIFIDVNYNITGKKVLLTAPSGSGKSTLFNILLGEYKGYRTKKDIKILLQNIDLQVLTSSIYDEINLGYKLKFKKDIPKNEVDEYLAMFKLNKKQSDDPNVFSGGEKKILLIICLVASKPDILILDEPYVSLDTRHINILDQYLQKTNINFIMSTHNIYFDMFDQKVSIKNYKLVGVDE